MPLPPKNLYPYFHPSCNTHHMERFGEVIPTLLKVIHPGMLNGVPIFEFLLFPQFFGGNQILQTTNLSDAFNNGFCCRGDNNELQMTCLVSFHVHSFPQASSFHGRPCHSQDHLAVCIHGKLRPINFKVALVWKLLNRNLTHTDSSNLLHAV